MSRPGFERLRRWLLPAALLAAAPKCALCLLAYTGLGAALGLAGPELCGATAPPDWLLWLAVGGGAALLARFALHRFPRP